MRCVNAFVAAKTLKYAFFRALRIRGTDLLREESILSVIGRRIYIGSQDIRHMDLVWKVGGALAILTYV